MRRAAAAPLFLAVFAAAPAAHGQGADAGPPPAPDAGPPAAGADAGPPQADEPLEAEQLSKPPVLVKAVEAEYPPEALEQGVEADVVLLLDISAEGVVESAAIAESADPPGFGFDEAALAAALKFKFEPAELDDEPIPVQINYRYKFRLPSESETTEEPPEPEVEPEEAADEAAEQRFVNFAGVLLERGTRSPIVGATITVFRSDGEPVGYEAVTDERGAFRFYNLEPGDWSVLAEPPGYYPLRTSDEVVAGQRTDVTYYLERGSYNQYDVTVTATRPKKEVNRTVLSAEKIDKVPGTAGDPLTVVQNFAGVARVPPGAPNIGATFAGQLVVRGSAPEDSLILVNGSAIPILHHFGGLKSVIPVGVLDSIEFYPGNFSPYYGRATGGIVDVQTKALNPEKTGGYVDVSLLDTGVFVEMPLGDKGGVAIAGRRSYIDGIMTAAVPDDAPVKLVTAPRYYDFQLLGNYRPAPEHDVRALVLGADDRMKILFKNPAELDPGLEDNAFSAVASFYRSMLTYRYVPSDRFENVLSVSQGRNWGDFRAAQVVFDASLYTAQFRDTVRQRLSERWRLTYGLDVQYYKDSGVATLPPAVSEGQPPGNMDFSDTTTSIFNDRQFWSPAAFIEGDWRPIPGLMLLPGLRVDSFGRTGELIPQPRFTARWQMSGDLTFKGGVGLFAQEPFIYETDENFGNPDLEAERAVHFSSGLELKPLEHLQFDVTGFYKHLTNLVSPTDRLVMEGGEARPLKYDNRGRGRVFGMELVARHEFTNNFYGWLTYTLSRAERRDSGADGTRLFDFDQPHILTVVGSYLLPRNWQLGGRFRLVSGNPRTPVVGSVYNVSADRYDPVYGEVNSERTGAFHQLDLRVDKRWIYKSWILNAYLDIQNVYNRQNPEAQTFNYDFSESEAQPGLPVLTIIGLRADF